MTELTEAWDAGPTQRYEALDALFRRSSLASTKEPRRASVTERPFMPNSGG